VKRKNWPGLNENELCTVNGRTWIELVVTGVGDVIGAESSINYVLWLGIAGAATVVGVFAIVDLMLSVKLTLDFAGIYGAVLATEVAALLLVVAVSFEFSLPVVDLDICLLAVVVEILLVAELACWLVVVAVENWWVAEDTLVALLAVIVLIDDTSEVAPEVAALTLVVLGLDVWSAFPCTGFANVIPKTLLITTIELSSTILWLVFLLYVLHFS